jgi:hypothetical protein
MTKFDPKNLRKRAFTSQEWTQVEDYLIEELNSIELPARVSPGDIQRLNSELDRLSSPVMWLYAITKRSYEGYEMDRKNGEKQVYMLVRDVVDDNGQPTGKKRTEAEIAAAIVDYLNSNPLVRGKTVDAQGNEVEVRDPASIYVMEKRAMERYVIIEAFVSTMRQKADKMITDLGAIKLEIQLSPNGDVDTDVPSNGRRVT